MNFWNQFPNKEFLLESMSLDGQNKIYNVNAHVHTPYSFSAFDSIDHALHLAAKENVRCVGINDFYTTAGYQEWAEKCTKYKIMPLFNIEFVGLSELEQNCGIRINDPSNPGRIYISGKGLSYPFKLEEPYYSELQGLTAKSNNQSKAMCSTSNAHFKRLGVGFEMSYTKILNESTKGMVRERHLAKALREIVLDIEKDDDGRKRLLTKLFDGKELESEITDNVSLENEIRSKLFKSGGISFIPETPDMFLNLEKVTKIILKSGGLPTYPLLANSVNGGFTEFEEDKEALLKTLEEKGIYSVEFITNRNTMDVLEEYATFFMENGFLVTLGSEHNTPELIPMKLFDKSGADLSPKLKDINYRSASILIAHQYMYARTGEGYLDSKGKPKLESFSDYMNLGKAIIEHFFKIENRIQ